MSEATLRTVAPGSGPGFDVEAVRQDFPILHQLVHGQPLAYLECYDL